MWGEPVRTPLLQEEVLISIASRALPFQERRVMIYSNCHFHVKKSHFGYDRQDAMNQVKKDLVFYEPTPLPRSESWKKQSQYAFVLSPHGNGLDCHRTWEALALGCIPIVKTSSLDPLYEDMPVLIVAQWSDVSLNKLYETIHSFQNRSFCYEKLRLEYWMKKIRAFLPIKK